MELGYKEFFCLKPFFEKSYPWNVLQAQTSPSAVKNVQPQITLFWMDMFELWGTIHFETNLF
jgi:hypothetical protein